MKRIVVYSLLLISAFAFTQEKKAASPSPKAIAEWLLKVYANYDMQSSANLTNYYKNTEEPKMYFTSDNVNVEEKAYRATLSELIEFPMAYESVVRPSIFSYYTNLYKVAAKASCKILSVSPPKKDEESEEIYVNVKYQCSCKVLDLENVPVLSYEDEASVVKSYYESLSTSLKSANENTSFEGEFILYQIEENNKKFWYSMDIEELSYRISNTMFGEPEYYEEGFEEVSSGEVDAEKEN